MSEPFLTEIKIVSFGFPPKGWALCNGQLLPINQNQATFSLLGTTYGGDGRVNFGLPNLQSRVPIHMGQGHTLGEVGGEQAHTLSIGEMPAHTHPVNANSGAQTAAPVAATSYPGSGNLSVYGAVPNIAMNAQIVGNIGGSQAHINMQPFLVLNFVIALQGIFPSQN